MRIDQMMGKEGDDNQTEGAESCLLGQVRSHKSNGYSGIHMRK